MLGARRAKAVYRLTKINHAQRVKERPLDKTDYRTEVEKLCDKLVLGYLGLLFLVAVYVFATR